MIRDKIRKWRRDEVLHEFGMEPGDTHYRKLKRIVKLYKKKHAQPKPKKPTPEHKKLLAKLFKQEEKLLKKLSRKEAKEIFTKLEKIVRDRLRQK